MEISPRIGDGILDNESMDTMGSNESYISDPESTTGLFMNSSLENDVQFDETSSIIASIVAMFCSCLGILINTLTVIMLFTQNSIYIHSLTPLMFYLTMSNLLISLVGLPMQASRFYNQEWPNWFDNPGVKYLTCKLYVYVCYPLIAIAFMSMVFIGIYRVATFYSNNNIGNYFSWKNCTFGVVILLAVTEIISGHFHYREKIFVNDNTFSCTICYEETELNHLVFVITLAYGISWILMLVSNGFTIFEMKRRFEGAEKMNGFGIVRRKSLLEKESNVSRAIATSVIGFTILYVPCEYQINTTN